MRFINPATGGYPMPTIGAFMQWLPAGFKGKPYRGTDATIFSVVEGRGRTVIGNTTVSWGPRDIFVAPSWQPITLESDGEAIIFSFSDRPAQKSLGLWREQAPIPA
jgi:gentisate 1,2-dioxygenase